MKNRLGLVLVLMIFISVHLAVKPATGQQAPPPGETGAGPLPKNLVSIHVVKETHQRLFRQLKNHLAECLDPDGAIDVESLDLYISNDQAGRITADTRITFYANKGYHVPQKGGGSTTEFRSIRIPSTDIPLKDVPKTCRDSRRKDILIDGLIEDLSEFQIISVPRIVSVQYQDTEYWWIIERTLIPGDILNQGERDEGHLINPTELERQRKWLVDLMAELHWDTYRLPFATYTEIEVPVVMETAPANNEPLRKKVLAILPSSLEVKDEVVEFVSYCRDFWEKFDEAIETSSRETQ